MLSDQNPVEIFLPAQGSCTQFLSSQGSEGLSLSAHQALELSTLEEETIRPLELDGMSMMNPYSSQEAVQQF